MINEKNATYFFIGNVANGIADEASYTSMANGSVAVVRALDNKNEESAISGTTPVRVVQKNADGTYVFSPIFSYSDILSKVKKDFVQDTQQVSYFGYDSVTNTTGFGTPVSGSTYVLHLMLNHTRNTYNNAPEIKTIPYKATSTSQADMAKGLQESTIRQFTTGREPYPVIRCERVCDTASVAAFTGSATIYKFTKGSTVVSTYIKASAGNTTLTASTASVTLADIVNAPSSNGRTFTFTANALGAGAGRHVIYIGETAYNVTDTGTDENNATAIAAAINAGTQATASASTTTVTITYNPGFYCIPPLVLQSADDSTFATIAVTIASGDAVPVKYKAAATTSSAATFTLDVPWQGETGYVYKGTTAASQTGVTTATGYWGLKFSGLEQPFNAAGLDELTNYLVSFDIATEDFGSLVEYKATKPKYGTGTYAQVAYQEMYSQWMDKAPIISKRPLTQLRTQAVAGRGYDLINLEIQASDVKFEAIGQSAKSKIRIIIATQQTPTDLANDALATVFNV